MSKRDNDTMTGEEIFDMVQIALIDHEYIWVAKNADGRLQVYYEKPALPYVEFDDGMNSSDGFAKINEVMRL